MQEILNHKSMWRSGRDYNQFKQLRQALWFKKKKNDFGMNLKNGIEFWVRTVKNPVYLNLVICREVVGNKIGN